MRKQDHGDDGRGRKGEDRGGADVDEGLLRLRDHTVQEVKRYTCLLRDYGEIAVNERVYYVRKSKTFIYF